jgi:hypothetical protein
MTKSIIFKSWVVWGALLALIGVYTALVTLVLKPEGTGEMTTILVPLLSGTTVMNLVLAFATRFFLRRSIRRSGIDSQWIGKYFGMAIVIWALSEAVAVYGFVLFMVGGSLPTFFIFAGISFVAMLLNTPALLVAKKSQNTLGPLGNRT